MNVTSRLATVLVPFAAVLLGGSAPVHAQQPQPAAPAPPPSPPPPYGPPYGYGPSAYNPGAPPNVHDGLFLRLNVGAGYSSVSATDHYGRDVKFSGGSLNVGLALGGAVA